VVAVLIAVACVAIGIAGFALGILSAAKNLPDLSQRSTNGAPITLNVTAGDKFATYASASSSATIACSFTPSAGITSEPGDVSFTFTSDGRDWLLVNQQTVATTGSYTYACGGTPFAIGDRPELGKFVGGVGVGLAALLGLPCIGLVVGSAIGIIVAVRRSSHRNRLRAAQQQPYYPH
jgi:hypothetical protein